MDRSIRQMYDRRVDCLERNEETGQIMLLLMCGFILCPV